jgi:hypothetical protein
LIPETRFRSVAARLAMLLAVSLISLTAPRCAPAEPQGLPSAAAVVKPQAYVSLDPVPRGREFEVAITVEIARGFHMNSHAAASAGNQAGGHDLSRRAAEEIHVLSE